MSEARRRYDWQRQKNECKHLYGIHTVETIGDRINPE